MTEVAEMARRSGTPEGVKEDIMRELPTAMVRKVNQFLYAGVDVVVDADMHPHGFYEGVRITMIPSWHPNIIKAGRELTDTLFSLQSKSWRTDMGTGKIKFIPNLGDAMVEHEQSVLQIVNWSDKLYDLQDNLVDMSEMSTLETRAFLRKNKLRRWRIHDSQTSLPAYDALEFSPDFAMGKFLGKVSAAVEKECANFLTMYRWIERNGPSGNRYAIGPGMEHGVEVDAEPGKN